MKYTLKKKWHTSQVEEVGDVFEAIDGTEYNGYLEYVTCTENNSKYVTVAPHEIALLVDAGYLEEDRMIGEAWIEHQIPVQEEENKKQVLLATPPPLDLWTEEPPEGTIYWKNRTEYHSVKTIECVWDGKKSEIYELRTNNCHRTKKSAEEALKRLLANK